MLQKVDVIVVGAGIAGLSHAWAAARRGRSVAVYERSPFARGASIRNFGMVWPIGQPEGPAYDAAVSSRALWLEAAQAARFWINPVGSICLALHEDEMAVLREYAGSGQGSANRCEVLSAQQTHKRCPAANHERVIGGMYSDTELGVDPRQAIDAIAAMLVERHGVSVSFDSPVISVAPGRVVLAGGAVVEARERVVVSSGADTKMHYPGVLDPASVVPCKLQMLATAAQPQNWTLGPMVYSGSTLAHYQAYSHCPSLPAMKQRINREQPALAAYGIHFMAAQHRGGDVILGDSHEYGDGYGPDLCATIDQLMIDGLRALLDLPDWSIVRRWQGVYLKSRLGPYLLTEPEQGVTVFNALGGAGMTLSLGVADLYWQTIDSTVRAGSTPSRLGQNKGAYVGSVESGHRGDHL